MDQNLTDFDTGADKLHEECGVFGMCDLDGDDMVRTIYYGPFVLQRRGQESCGIAVSDTEGPKGKMAAHERMGPCSEVFTPEVLEGLGSSIGVDHVRYFTAGSSTEEDAQPLVLNYVKETLGLTHNGNLVSTPEPRRELEYTGATFQTIIDSGVIAYHIARARIHTRSVENATAVAMKKFKGVYSLVIMSSRKLIEARDPMGLEPLRIGKRDSTYVLALETRTLETIGTEFIRDMDPGEIVTITKDGVSSDKGMCLPDPPGEVRCTFEYIYLARPDSVFGGVSVHKARIQANRFLTADSPVEADLVVGVLEFSNAATLSYAMESGIPCGITFVEDSCVGKTFVKLKQSSRESAVCIKSNVLKEAVSGKRVIMIDDSIVRGVTSVLIVKMLRGAGVRKVHVRTSIPPFLYPCYFGMDIPSEDQPIVHGRTMDEVGQTIGADTLFFLRQERLSQIASKRPVCTARFTGNHPMESPPGNIRGSCEKQVRVFKKAIVYGMTEDMKSTNTKDMT